MDKIVNEILPILLIFSLGYLLKIFRILNQNDANSLLKLVFYISFPALIIVSVASIDFKPEFAVLPLIASGIIILSYIISRVLMKKTKATEEQKGVFVISTMIMNTGFVLPFIISAYGNEGLARITIFDIANGIITYTYTYFIALKIGKGNSKKGYVTKKLLLSFPIWAFAIGFIFNLFDVGIIGKVSEIFNMLGSLTIPLIMIALGIFFNPKVVLPQLIIKALFVRVFMGFAFGYLICYFIGFDDISRKIILIGASAPVGYNTLVFASLANLDQKFAASLISYSLMLGVIVTTCIIIFPI